jgi:hypothetical protein
MELVASSHSSLSFFGTFLNAEWSGTDEIDWNHEEKLDEPEKGRQTGGFTVLITTQ